MASMFDPYSEYEQRTTDAFGTLLHHPRGNPFGSLIPWAEQEAISQSLQQLTALQASGESSTSPRAASSASGVGSETLEQSLRDLGVWHSLPTRVQEQLRQRGTPTGPLSKPFLESTEQREKESRLRAEQEQARWDSHMRVQEEVALLREAEEAWKDMYGPAEFSYTELCAWFQQETWPFPEEVLDTG